MSEPAVPAAAPAAKPAAKAGGDGHGEKKGGLNWGLPLFIILMGVAVTYLFRGLYENKDAIEWTRAEAFRIGIPIGLIMLLVGVFKSK